MTAATLVAAADDRNDNGQDEAVWPPRMPIPGCPQICRGRRNSRKTLRK